MTDPRRIQRSLAKGWRMPAGAVYVGRPSAFGNPWHCIAPHVGCPTQAGYRGPPDLQCCVVRYREWLQRGADLNATATTASTDADLTASITAHRLANLRGKTLACWCALDKPCHADVLLELANAPLRCEGADA